MCSVQYDCFLHFLFFSCSPGILLKHIVDEAEIIPAASVISYYYCYYLLLLLLSLCVYVRVCCTFTGRYLYFRTFSACFSTHFCHMKSVTIRIPFHYHEIRCPVYCKVWFCPSPLTTLSHLCILFWGFVA
jgi:hypothetical protein